MPQKLTTAFSITEVGYCVLYLMYASQSPQPASAKREASKGRGWAYTHTKGLGLGCRTCLNIDHANNTPLASTESQHRSLNRSETNVTTRSTIPSRYVCRPSGPQGLGFPASGALTPKQECTTPIPKQRFGRTMPSVRWAEQILFPSAGPVLDVPAGLEFRVPITL